MDADLDTLATAFYVTCDDLLKEHPERVPARPLVGIDPQISDAELLTLSVMQALLGYTSEARWLRYAHRDLAGMFPIQPQQSGYNKRLRKLAATMTWLITMLAAATSIADDDLWLVDSTPVECGRSRETAHRSDLAGWAEYGYCASHSRYFWGLRLHLVTTVHGLPVGWALTGAKADERQVLTDILVGTALPAAGRSPTLIGDKNY
ncbi:MAG: transposase, partial [Humibacillus sp.]|nr:transposase [Humibacillus sp.]MDN5777809.1 transposase [Humibacillus sp.]